MQFLPMSKLGPRDEGQAVSFGIYLPGISSEHGCRLRVRMIHEKDQFIEAVPPFDQYLEHSVDTPYGEPWDYWTTTVSLTGPGNGGHWGELGRYVYRYALDTPNGETIDWVIDPFAREFGVGKHAAWTYGYKAFEWPDEEAHWRTPLHRDLVMYELNIMEFAGSLELARERLDYLHDLGINCISLMPVTNVADTFDWGYSPIGYFGVDERFGKRSDFQQFVAAAHQAGIAVLVDAVYGHTSDLFAYEYLYSRARLPNPMMGSFAKDDFGASVDWTRPFSQDFFYSVNRLWLEKFHVDGFRYDCVPNYWELAPNYRGFAEITYRTYQYVKEQVAACEPGYARFSDGFEPLRLIQCAEQLEVPAEALKQTYATCTWQTKTLSKAREVARGSRDAISALGHCLGADGMPTQVEHEGDRIHKSPLQYLETHDESRFVCVWGVQLPPHEDNPLYAQGDRAKWYRVQPYLIGLLLAKGIPLLCQGQELCENAQVASKGLSRISFLRPVQWEHFYDPYGRGTIRLVRRLLDLRARIPHMRDGAFYFFDDERYRSQGTLLYARYYPDTPAYTLVALNLTDEVRHVPFWFPLGGDYREELHGAEDGGLSLGGVQAYGETWLQLPGNYGRVWTHCG